MKQEIYNITTVCGKCKEKSQLPFLTDEEFDNFNSIGYSGKTINGTKTNFMEDYLNSLNKGNFSIGFIKNDGWVEYFLILRTYEETNMKYDMSRQYEVDTINKDFHSIIMSKLEELGYDVNPEVSKPKYRYLIIIPANKYVGGNTSKNFTLNTVEVSINKLFEILEQHPKITDKKIEDGDISISVHIENDVVTFDDKYSLAIKYLPIVNEFVKIHENKLKT
jgi:hypothetical protein